MASAKKCDLCASLYPDNNHMKAVTYYYTKDLSLRQDAEVTLTVRPVDRYNQPGEPIDVCPDCTEEIFKKAQEKLK